MATNKLGEILQQDGWQLAELASLTGISTSYLKKIRKQNRTPSISFMNRIIRALNDNSRRSQPSPYQTTDVFPNFPT